MGEAVGKAYVAKWFPPSSKTAIQEMVTNLLAAFGRRIDGLAWMSDGTKAKAKAKLKTLRVGVGYPDEWRDDSKLSIVKGDAYGNAGARAAMFDYEANLAKLGQPVKHGAWVMTPQTVNAVNLPVRNEIQFPAAILSAPFFDPNATAAASYGSTGATIRPRDQPQLRRRRIEVRRARSAHRLVDAGRPRSLPSLGRGARGSVQRVQTRSPTRASTASRR